MYFISTVVCCATPEQSPPQPHPDDTGPKEQLESFADQVDYLSDHPSETEKTENESENLDTGSAEHTAAAPPWKRKKLDVSYQEQRKQGQIHQLEEMKECGRALSELEKLLKSKKKTFLRGKKTCRRAARMQLQAI